VRLRRGAERALYKESLFPTGLIFDCPGAAWFRLPRFPSGYAGASRIKDAIGK